MRLPLLLILAVIGLIACDSDTSNQQSGSNPAASQRATGGSVGQPVAPDLDIPETSALLANYWVFEFYIDRKDRSKEGSRVGTWYRFLPDGTFTAGQWEEQTNSGVWSVRRANDKVLLTIDSNVDALDTEYDLQGMTQSQDAMSWVGTPRFDNSHIMLKAINLLTQPTKKQFGVAE